MEPIKFRVFDWDSSGEEFKSALCKWGLTYDLYVVLECLTRQALMRLAGYKLEPDFKDPGFVAANFKDPSQYLEFIRRYINRIENFGREEIDRVQKWPEGWVKQVTQPGGSFLKIGKESAEHEAFVLCGGVERSKIEGRPSVFLPYGIEKIVFWKIVKDIESVPAAEGAVEDDVFQKLISGSWKSRFGRKYLKEIRGWFGFGERAPGGYLEGIPEKDEEKHFGIRLYLDPSVNEFFRFYLAAHYCVFYRVLAFDAESDVENRPGFDMFVAKKLEYTCRDAAEGLEQRGYKLSNLFERETIKDRIRKNDKFIFQCKEKIEKTGLINDTLVQHLAEKLTITGKRRPAR